MPTPPTGLEPWTPVAIKTISVTERADFRKDRRQWFLHSVHRLEGPGAAIYFQFGTAMHLALEAFHTQPEDGNKIAAALVAFHTAWTIAQQKAEVELGFLWPYAKDEWDEHTELGEAMLNGYYQADFQAGKPFNDYPLLGKTTATEQRYTVRIPGTTGKLTGKIDLLTEPAPGEIRAMDHKNLSTQNNPADLDLDDQLTAYAWLYRQATGRRLDSVGHNVLIKKLPLTKSGKPTTSILFVRDITFRTEAQLAEFEKNLVQEWRDMKRVAAHPEMAYPNNTAINSRGCPVHSICIAMANQEDTEGIIRAGYVVGDPRV
jgi:RecB family exonuclease